jgi:hypothetical protein
MKKLKPVRFFPVSQRDLAAYLGISATLLNMTKTGRHGSRQLRSASSNKMTELMLAHQQSLKTNAQSESLKKMQARSANDCSRLAKGILQVADHADAHAAILKHRLDELAVKEQQDKYWLHTVDKMLATLPKTRESAKDRIWLENQQVIVLERLRRNGRLAQVKLETEIEMEKARARVYRDVQKKLLKK